MGRAGEFNRGVLRAMCATGDPGGRVSVGKTELLALLNQVDDREYAAEDARREAAAGAVEQVWESVRAHGGDLADRFAKALQDRLGPPAGQIDEILRRAGA